MKTIDTTVRWIDVSETGIDPISFYNEHYAGLTRGKLHQKDPALYSVLRRRGLIIQIPRKNKDRIGKDQQYLNNNPLEEYKRNYAGMTREELKQENYPLYTRLAKISGLSQIPKKQPFEGDPVAYYTQHYAGIPRGKLGSINYKLYQLLRTQKLLAAVPKLSRAKPDLVAYCQENYPGITRQDLRGTNRSLYERMRVAGVLNLIPRRYPIKKPIKPIDIEQIIKEYEENYPGVSRSELRRENWRLYNQLLRVGKIEIILNHSKRVSNEELLTRYSDKYNGLTRGQLQRANNGLYSQLRQRKLLNAVPIKARKTDEEYLQRYQQNYTGIPRGELCAINSGLYEQLRQRKLLNAVPFATRKTAVPVKTRKTDEEYMIEYQQNYAGIPRQKLNIANHGLYEKLRKRKLLNIVPCETPKTDEEYMIEYQQNYAGMPRGELSVTNQALYTQLIRRNLLFLVPTQKELNQKTIKPEEQKQEQ